MASFEWDLEKWEGDEIVEHDQRSRLGDNEELRAALAGSATYKLALVRDSDNYYNNVDRTWAYVTNGQLPEMLSDANDVPRYRVPARYRRAFEAAKRRLR